MIIELSVSFVKQPKFSEIFDEFLFGETSVSLLNLSTDALFSV